MTNKKRQVQYDSFLCSIGTYFFRTHLSAYFIMKVAATDRQAREHLAQAEKKQMKKKKKKKKKQKKE
jgi:hypothetical protein